MAFLLIITYYFFLKCDLILSTCLENEFDFIVVGAGSSGAVIATRLSEIRNSTVLLLEAGKEPLAESYIPLIGGQVLSEEMIWNYTSMPQENGGQLFKNNMIPLPSGKALGGSSSVNGMGYTRGNKKDYDLWHKQGNPGWDFKSLYYYFLKIEDYRVPQSRYDEVYHHRGGPITVSLAAFQTPMSDAFLQAGLEVGQPLVDFNAKYQTGFMHLPANIKNGARCSTYNCYLQPVLKRKNLHVLTNAFVTKIITSHNKKKAIGVEYEKQLSNCVAKARKEVIISAGAVNSPQLLMLSGIGPEKLLKEVNISVVKDLPGVGQNFQDHVLVTGLAYEINQSITYDSILRESKKYLDIWSQSRTGPMTCPGTFEGIAYYQSKLVTDATDWPDIEISFSSATSAQLLSSGGSSAGDQVTFRPYLLRPKSRGKVTLRSKNAHDPPLINPNYLSHPDDVDGLVIALNFTRRLAETKAFRQYGATLVKNNIIINCSSSTSNSEEFDKCLIRGLLNSALHVAGTCKMGPKSDHMAVVDSRLRVYGMENLRVADASIMPNLISAHPNVACMVIGEKAADMIKQDNEL